MRLTRSGVALLTGAACCYLLGEIAGYTVLRMLAGVAAGSLAVATFLARSRPAVQISRTVQPDRVERGRPALASLEVHNPTGRWLPVFMAQDRIGTETRQIQVRPLAPGATAAYHYELPTKVRGRHGIGPLTLHRGDPFDLVRSLHVMSDSGELWVDPLRHPVRAARVGQQRHHYDGPVASPPLPGSVDLLAVREYVVGDEVRHVHWKASARTGQLMVREYADPGQTRLTVLLDTRTGVMSPELFEEALEVAASLVYATVAAGQPCRLITSAGKDSTVDGGLRQARTLLDPLCLATQDAASSLPLAPLGPQRPDGELVVISGPATEAYSWRPDLVIRLGGKESAASVIAAADAAAAVAAWNAWPQ